MVNYIVLAEFLPVLSVKVNLRAVIIREALYRIARACSTVHNSLPSVSTTSLVTFRLSDPLKRIGSAQTSWSLTISARLTSVGSTLTNSLGDKPKMMSTEGRCTCRRNQSTAAIVLLLDGD